MLKETLISWLIKFVEIVLVSVLSLVICFIVVAVTGEQSLGTAVVGIVFYFFTELIRPYVKDIQFNLTKNIERD